jgi:hypothetical protein
VIIINVKYGFSGVLFSGSFRPSTVGNGYTVAEGSAAEGSAAEGSAAEGSERRQRARRRGHGLGGTRTLDRLLLRELPVYCFGSQVVGVQQRWHLIRLIFLSTSSSKKAPSLHV